MPRLHQREATSAILAARSSGCPGFLLGDMTGLGKTLAVWCAVAAMPEREVLIVCPKGAIPQWRRTIALAGCPEKTVTLINYERSKSLMTLVAANKRRSTRAKNNELAKHGEPRKTWPIVVFDESHRLRNPYAQQSRAAELRFRQKASLLRVAGTADFAQDLLEAPRDAQARRGTTKRQSRTGRALSRRDDTGYEFVKR